MLEIAINVALLAPVPRVHLEHGRIVCDAEGRVAYGSRAWEVFRELDRLRHGLPVNVYIYPSHSDPPSLLETSWKALYIGHVESQGGAHPEGMRFRPESTAWFPSDNEGFWAVFWEVTNLREVPVPERIKISDFTGYGKRGHYKRDFIPEGPLLVELP
jgi:hypothetical protein